MALKDWLGPMRGPFLLLTPACMALAIVLAAPSTVCRSPLMTAAIDAVVRTALAEDVGAGDVTTDGVVPAGARCRALLALEEPGIVCGVPVVRAVFAALSPETQVEALLDEGVRVEQVPARVAAVDGLKIEPLASDVSGVTPTGERVPFRPIHDVTELYESLDNRDS